MSSSPPPSSESENGVRNVCFKVASEASKEFQFSKADDALSFRRHGSQQSVQAVVVVVSLPRYEIVCESATELIFVFFPSPPPPLGGSPVFEGTKSSPFSCTCPNFQLCLGKSPAFLTILTIHVRSRTRVASFIVKEVSSLICQATSSFVVQCL